MHTVGVRNRMESSRMALPLESPLQWSQSRPPKPETGTFLAFLRPFFQWILCVTPLKPSYYEVCAGLLFAVSTVAAKQENRARALLCASQ